MLPGLSLPASLSSLLAALAGCFTAPTFRVFCALVVGLVEATSRRTVCGMWIAAGLSRLAHHARAHRFFSQARWSPDAVGLALAALVVDRFVAAGAPLLVAVDDTLFHRYGRKVHAAAWQHDGSAQGPRKLGFGNNWVVVGIVVRLPILSRPVCLPVLARLWRPKSDVSKVEHAVDLVRLLADSLGGRRMHVVGDAAYHGPACKNLPAGVTWTCRLQRNAVLCDLAPPRTGRRGRPALKGKRLGTPTDLAATATWRKHTVTRYGRVEVAWLASVHCLWYGAFGPREVQVVLVREQNTTTTTGYDLALVSTDLQTARADIVGRYADRWSIEVVNHEAKHILGVGQARNRVRTAVERTVPFGLLTMSIVIIWYVSHGHHPADITARRARSPWYATKHEPALEDMLVKLRRALIAARFSPAHPAQPTPDEILEVTRAWAAATA
jgi:hypothetical protein